MVKWYALGTANPSMNSTTIGYEVNKSTTGSEELWNSVQSKKFEFYNEGKRETIRAGKTSVLISKSVLG